MVWFKYTDYLLDSFLSKKKKKKAGLFQGPLSHVETVDIFSKPQKKTPASSAMTYTTLRLRFTPDHSRTTA